MLSIHTQVGLYEKYTKVLNVLNDFSLFIFILFILSNFIVGIRIGYDTVKAY